MSPTFFYAFSALVFLPLGALAHIAAWDDSMFGRCGTNNQCDNAAEASLPLQELPFSKWWWHGFMDYPPPADSVMELPAGQSITVQLSGNVAFTKLGPHNEAFWPGGGSKDSKDMSMKNNPAYWGGGLSGNLHTTGQNDIAGCALSIAYTSNAKDVRPEDMVIFSVQHDCVWQKDTVFDVPADMPPCPDGKCMCSWWWIHNSDGGMDQMYQTAFQCNVTQSKSTIPVGSPVPPENCEDNKDACIKGPKMPMYWKQQECNNMQEPGHLAPTYSDKYGFAQGAQNDIFQTVNHNNWTCPQSTAAGVSKYKSRRSVLPNSAAPEPATAEPAPRPHGHGHRRKRLNRQMF